jgi:hypothetical protein
MVDDINVSIRKILKYTPLYPIVGHTKTRKLLLTRMRTKYNALILRDYIVQFFTRQYWWCNILLISTFFIDNDMARTPIGNK